MENLSEGKMPKHVAIIMDGNRRWAKKNNKKTFQGHREGVETMIKIVEESAELGMENLTVYAFSTENWGREKTEVSYLMKLLVEFLNSQIDRIDSNNIKLNMFGNLEDLPDAICEKVKSSMSRTENNTRMNFNICMSYGSRYEILRAVKNVSEDVKNNVISSSDIDDNLFSSYLYTKGIADPDLMIRTSGEIRLSNFLLYQLAYSEMYFTDVLWPDFTREEYHKAIVEYQNRSRRYGKN